MHADRFAAALKAEAPKIKKIAAAPVVGYFLDHDNFEHTNGLLLLLFQRAACGA